MLLYYLLSPQDHLARRRVLPVEVDFNRKSPPSFFPFPARANSTRPRPVHGEKPVTPRQPMIFVGQATIRTTADRSKRGPISLRLPNVRKIRLIIGQGTSRSSGTSPWFAVVPSWVSRIPRVPETLTAIDRIACRSLVISRKRGRSRSTRRGRFSLCSCFPRNCFISGPQKEISWSWRGTASGAFSCIQPVADDGITGKSGMAHVGEAANQETG